MSLETFFFVIAKIREQPFLILVFWFFCIVCAGGIYWTAICYRKTFLRLISILSVTPVVYYLLACILYLIAPSFKDHIEPSIVMLSMLVNEGIPIYSQLDSPERVSLLYGPASYLLNSFILHLVGNSMIAGKLGGVVLAVCSGLILLVSFGKSLWRPAVFASIGFYILVYLPFGHKSFWNRPDTVIIFACSIACGALFVKNRILFIILTSLAISLAVNSKIHAILYLLPLFFLSVEKMGWRTVWLSWILSAVLIVFPFLCFSSFSLPCYIQWLSQATSHKMLLWLLTKNIIYITFFLTPLFIGAYFYNTTGKHIYGHFSRGAINKCILTLLLSSLIMIIVASKDGAGPHHFMPFAPVMATLLCLVLSSIHDSSLVRRDNTSLKRISIVYCLGLAWILTILVISWQPQLNLLKFVSQDSGESIAVDLIDIMRKYPNYSIMMGYSDIYGYKYTFYRPILFDRTKEYFLDAPALMDMGESNLEIPDGTIKKIQSQAYDIYLIPNIGEPFSMATYYTSGGRVFGDSLSAAFKRHYMEIDKSNYFSIWISNNHTTR